MEGRPIVENGLAADLAARTCRVWNSPRVASWKASRFSHSVVPRDTRTPMALASPAIARTVRKAGTVDRTDLPKGTPT
jgi:hypothetical protein